MTDTFLERLEDAVCKKKTLSKNYFQAMMPFCIVRIVALFSNFDDVVNVSNFKYFNLIELASLWEVTVKNQVFITNNSEIKKLMNITILISNFSRFGIFCQPHFHDKL